MAEDDEFAASLRTAIERSGMSLTEITHRLRSFGHVVTPAALSTWQQGRRKPDPVRSFEILASLETVLDQPPDALLELARAPHPRGRAMRHTEVAAFVPDSEPLRRAYAELGFIAESSFPHERFVHELLVIDSESSVQVLTFQIMVRALVDGPCRFPAAQQFTPEEPNVEPRIVPLEGCSVARRLAWPEDRTYATELLINPYLEAGQQAFFSFQIHFRAEARDVLEVNYALPRRSQDFMVEAEFRGPLRPVDCEQYRHTGGGREESAPVRLHRGALLQAAVSGFGPGMLGLRWRWPEDRA